MRIAAYIGYIGKVSSNVRAEYKKRTQQRQTVVFGSIIAVMAVLLVLGTLTWSGLLPFPFEREFSKAPDTNAVVCPIDGAGHVDPTTITAKVFNSSNRSGLAGSVATSLSTAGVVVSETANWAGDKFLEPVRIYTSSDGVTSAYTLRAYFPDATVHIDPNITNQVVEVVLGSGYTEMVASPTKEQLTEAMAPIKGCTPLADFEE
ncbi:LytR family transcriptional regulator [Trueperella pyogenes]|uniref:LytR family transcriptional regulator n=1 Tax=Trueperella pyogenes TaxID=1661 RepID=A0A3S9QLR6_9ACTO|nr:hypothetical protein X956_01200 [Trueperella pyogenes TP8]AWG03871.1 hypothetical protein DC090_05210 [Trueperella pyogenes]AWG16601.1 hypothetical protein DDE06_07140 [Trueperella pyogenes]AZR05480.1 LytR family transcriptional regulator [Trueperella pyogenes]AZR06886.1 LytR family transcriptional regulator [Trueperella pyogenes]